MHVRWLVVVLMLGLVACGPTTGEEDADGGGGNHGDGGVGQQDAAPPPPPNAHLRGVVFAPNGRTFNPPLTVSGALVYVADNPPAPISPTIGCERCTDVPAGAIWAKTDETGAFDLNIWDGSYIVVIQKGQFRLVRSVVVGKNQTLDMVPEDTTLPSKNSNDGNESIPKIALLAGSFDKLEGLFAKLGFATLDAAGQAVTWDNNVQFDVYSNGGSMPPAGNPANKGTAAQLFANYELMKTYHIIFVPCSSTNSAVVQNATAKQNINQYVREGGKYYVADWSYDYLRQFWDLVHFDGDDGATVGSANSASFDYAPYDAVGHAIDQDLFKWLEAQQTGWGGDNLNIKENWDWVTNLTEGYVGDGPDGTPVYAKPDVIVEGPRADGASWKTTPAAQIYPMTLGFPYGCGRVFYTTYHTVGDMSAGHAGLEVQERILVYLIMEIGVCQSGPILE